MAHACISPVVIHKNSIKMNSAHRYPVRIKFVKAHMCPFLLDRLKDQQANSTKFVKANMCLFLLGRLEDQQTNSTKSVKANMCIFLLGRLEDQ